jgi:hypothetical protein
MQKIPSELLSEWTSIINEVEENGYEIRRYCREQKLKEKKYYYWRRRKREFENPSVGFTKLKFSSSENKISAGFSVLFKNGISIIPEEQFSEVEFLRAVRLLHGLQPC